MKNRHASLGLAGLCLQAFIWGNTPAYSAVVTFDDAGDLAANFQQNTGGTARYEEAANGGLNNTRAVAQNPTSTDTTAAYTGESFKFTTVGHRMMASMFVKVTANTAASTMLQLGFGGDDTTRFEGGPRPAFISLRVQTTAASGLPVALQAVYKPTDANTGTSISTVATGASLISGNWYLFTADFQNNGAGEVLFSGSLVDYGVSGLVAGATKLTVTDHAVAGLSAITADPSLYAAFRGFNGAGADLYDNFEAKEYAIPEPSVVMLMMMGSMTFLACLKRGRRISVAVSE